MRIIILEKIKRSAGSKYHFPGDQFNVTKEFGNELVKNKVAGEIPHGIDGLWYLQGLPSKRMSALWKPKKFPVTLEEYYNSIKKIKEKK